MKVLVIIAISFLLVATYALMKVASDADDQAEKIHDSKEEK